MSFEFEIHHIFTREMMKFFGPQIAELFQPNEFNPFSLDNNINKIPLLVDATLVNALPPELQAVLKAAGIGENVHNGGHYGFNEFQKAQLAEIFKASNGLTTAQQKLALYDLHSYSTKVAMDGQPPLSGTSQADWQTHFDNNSISLGTIKTYEPGTTDTALSSLVDRYNAFDAEALSQGVSDVGSPWNQEARGLAVSDLLKAIVGDASADPALLHIFEQQAAFLDSPAFNPKLHSGFVSDWAFKALYESVKAHGINPTTLTPSNNPPSEIDQKIIDHYQRQLDLFNEIARLNERLPNTGEVPTNHAIGSVETIKSLKAMLDHLRKATEKFGSDEDGALDIGSVRDGLQNLIDRVNSGLAALENSGSIVDFKTGVRNLLDALDDLSGRFQKALSDMPGGSKLAFLGSLGDIAQISTALGEAYDQYEAGDYAGAIQTVASLATSMVISNGVALIAFAGLTALGITGAPLLLLSLAAGVLAEMEWQGYEEKNPDWLHDLWLKFNPIDPIVIDLDGDGIELTRLEGSTAFFDLDGDGFAENTGWVSPDDGLLVIDRNGNGTIDSIEEAFGSASETGFTILKELDSNQDGLISSVDETFSELRIWRDIDGDGQTDAGELQTLTASGIQSISLTTNNMHSSIAGNQVIGTSTVTRIDGTTTKAAEVLFALSQVDSEYVLPDEFTFDEDVFALPTLRGFGEIPDLWVAMTNGPGLQTEAQNMIAQARAGQFNSFAANFEEFLADWAGVEDAIWRQDVSVDAFFAYDREHLLDYHQWRIDHPDIIIDGTLYRGDPYPGPKPKLQGYYFAPTGALPDLSLEVSAQELEQWLEEYDLAIAYHLNGSMDFWDFPITTYQAPSVVVGSGGPITIQLPPNIFGEGSGAPDMDAMDFAFLQKLMGQDFRRGATFLADERIIVTTPDPDEVDPLIESYHDVKDYMMSRFLAQSAWSILMTEGPDADLGALAPFKNLFYNPLNDELAGNQVALTRELIAMYRDENLGSDANALDLLAIFAKDMPTLGGLVLSLFPEIDQALVASTFEIENVIRGTADGDLLASSQNAHIIAGEGSDTVSGGSGEQAIFGNSGDDQLNGGGGSDTYVYSRGDGNDIIIEQIHNGSEDRLVLADVAFGDVELLRDGNNLTLVIAESETGAGDGGSILLMDTLLTYYQRGVEVISFSDGVSFTQADLRELLLTNTTADETFTGFWHSDVFRYNRGDGHDTIIDRMNEGNADQLLLSDIRLDEVTFVRDGNDVTIVIDESTPGEGDDGSILIKDTLRTYYSRGVETILFQDGAILTQADLRDHFLTSTSANETIVGFADSDTFYYSRGGGSDTIIETMNGGSNDQLMLTDINANEVTFVRNGNDLAIVIAESSSGAGDGGYIQITDTLETYYGQGIEKILFADGTTVTQFDLRDHFLTSTTANEILVGFGGSDTFRYSRGDGHDTIIEAMRAGSSDQLLLTDINANQVTLVRNGNDVTVMIAESSPGAGDGGSILIKETLDNYYSRGVESIVFADGTSWNRAKIVELLITSAGTSGNDTIMGTNSADVLRGGLGTDSLNGGAGDDTYIFARGDGSDTIIEAMYGGTNDQLLLTNINANEVAFVRNGDDLTLAIAESSSGAGDGGSILMKDMLETYYGRGVEKIVFADGTTFTQSDLRDHFLTSSSANETLVGFDGSDTFRYSRGGGHDIIIEAQNAGSSDRLLLTDINPEAVSLVRTGNDLTLVIAETAPGAGDGGSILIKDTLTSYYSTGIEQITFANGTTWTQAYLRDVLLAGSAANQTLIGFTTNDTFRYSRGGGHDIIIEDWRAGSNDKLLLTDINPEAVTLLRNGNDLTLVIAESVPGAGDGGSILIKDTLVSYYDSGIEQITFANGTTWTQAYLRDVLLTGSAANQTLTGFTTNDTFRYSRGGGHDIIIEDWRAGSNDKLLLTDINPEAVTLLRNGNDLTLVIAESVPGAGDGGSILIKDTLVSYYDSGLEQIIFANGTIWTQSTLRSLVLAQAATAGHDIIGGFDSADLISGEAGNDTLNGNAGNDTLFGGDGNDILDGGGGNDSMAGGMGDDIYIVNSVADVIVEAPDAGVDLVQSSVAFTLGTGLDHLTLTGSSGLAGTGNGLANILTGNSGANILTGLDGSDTIFGGGGHDTLFGGADSDFLDGGTGNDSMSGGLGDDSYVVDSSSDAVIEAAGEGLDGVTSSVSLTLAANVENLTLSGTSGLSGTGNALDNILIGNSGANTLSGLDGNDRLLGGGGNDTLTGGLGADQFVFNSTSGGVNTIMDFNQLDGGEDEFDLLRFEGLGVGTFAYLGTGAFSGGSDNSEARVSGNQVLVDTNGDGVADITITLTGLTNANQLAVDDFVFV